MKKPLDVEHITNVTEGQKLRLMDGQEGRGKLNPDNRDAGSCCSTVTDQGVC